MLTFVPTIDPFFETNILLHDFLQYCNVFGVEILLTLLLIDSISLERNERNVKITTKSKYV